MSETTGIGWCDSTFNPWIGCEKVSPGCAHCYAETLVTGRMNRSGTWGANGVRRRTSESNWKKPARWERLAQSGLLPDGKTKADHRPRVFCASLADVFEPRSELAPWRADLFRIIMATPSLDWLVLTKRPEMARDWLAARGDHVYLANVWLGVSIENARYTWRADVLREIPAAVRFISAEPLLGSLFEKPRPRPGQRFFSPHDWPTLTTPPKRPLNLTDIDWVICGGESGRGFRPMNLDHAREIRDACLRVGTEFQAQMEAHDVACNAAHRPAFFFKQDSGLRAGLRGRFADENEWPREFPGGVLNATR